VAWNVGKDKVGLLQSLSMPVRFESQVSNEKVGDRNEILSSGLPGISQGWSRRTPGLFGGQCDWV